MLELVDAAYRVGHDVRAAVALGMRRWGTWHAGAVGSKAYLCPDCGAAVPGKVGRTRHARYHYQVSLLLRMTGIDEPEASTVDLHRLAALLNETLAERQPKPPARTAAEPVHAELPAR